jgi:hypothetical protein
VKNMQPYPGSTQMPETLMPETQMPETLMPETQMPETQMPETQGRCAGFFKAEGSMPA